MLAQVQRMTHHVLHFGGVLCGAVNMKAIVLFGHDVTNLTFEIELLLTVDIELPAEGVRRTGHRCVRFSARQ